mmetsp:Transcript_27722/g.65042  ORF Transcript_27722/g.65042 Transcript_27722/m.65042 type:complete len:237 (-) Transcript_27722:769-1479(-)
MRPGIQVDDMDAIGIGIALGRRWTWGPGKHVTGVHPEALVGPLRRVPRIALRHRHVVDELGLAAGQASVVAALPVALAEVVVVPRPGDGDGGVRHRPVQAVGRIGPALVVPPPLGLHVPAGVVHVVAQPQEQVGPKGPHVLPQHRRDLPLGPVARPVREARDDGAVGGVQVAGGRQGRFRGGAPIRLGVPGWVGREGRERRRGGGGGGRRGSAGGRPGSGKVIGDGGGAAKVIGKL